MKKNCLRYKTFFGVVNVFLKMSERHYKAKSNGLWNRLVNTKGNYGYNSNPRHSVAEARSPLNTISTLSIRGIASNQVKDKEDQEIAYNDAATTYGIDPNQVRWDDFNNKSRLEDNIQKLLSCKKVLVKLDLAKVDYIPGILAVPVFHCPRCLDLWRKSKSIPEKCDEKSQPTRGKPIALDDEANYLLLSNNLGNISYIQIHGRNVNTTRQAGKRRKTIMTAFDYDEEDNGVDLPQSCGGSRSSQSPASPYFFPSTGGSYPPKSGEGRSINKMAVLSEEKMSEGIRKYGGLNLSEARLLIESKSEETEQHDGIKSVHVIKNGRRDHLRDYPRDLPLGDGSNVILSNNNQVLSDRTKNNDQSDWEDKSCPMNAFRRLSQSANSKQKNLKQQNDKFNETEKVSFTNALEEKKQIGKKVQAQNGMDLKIFKEKLKGSEEEKLDRTTVQKEKPGVHSSVEISYENDESSRHLISIDETAVIGNKDTKINNANKDSVSAEESPAEILSRMKNRKLKTSVRNAGVWDKTAANDKQNHTLVKHVMSTSGGGGIQQFVEESSDVSVSRRNSARKGSIPVGSEDLFLMQGGKQPVSRRQKRGELRNRPNRAFASSDSLGMSYTQSGYKYENDDSDARGNPEMRKSADGRLLSSRGKNKNNEFINNISVNNINNDDTINAQSNVSSNVKVRRGINKKERRTSVDKSRSNKLDFELPPVEILKPATNAPGSSEILALNYNHHDSRPSSRLHSACLNGKDADISDRMSSPVTIPLIINSHDSKPNTSNLFPEVKKQNIFCRQNLFNPKNNIKHVESSNRAPARETLTPSPKLSQKISCNELMCLTMRNFTSSFTFSFYDLPEQYRRNNDFIKNKAKSSKLKNKKKK
ncbi:uncharacterized protein LOC130621992 isoform X2 [Hydractinia symbiolongicarpus]|uniref:uncharacterized protein LOC130621992 isoform X2 n=1 Tax=Hydractinia symbiolongicarpus TaxID=13093 RepID=UPI00254A240A|nr:uncharacterized protein LOC130621992 isoform X2 [Hydractinia symbiolongicarpus]